MHFMTQLIIHNCVLDVHAYVPDVTPCAVHILLSSFMLSTVLGCPRCPNLVWTSNVKGKLKRAIDM